MFNTVLQQEVPAGHSGARQRALPVTGVVIDQASLLRLLDRSPLEASIPLQAGTSLNRHQLVASGRAQHQTVREVVGSIPKQVKSIIME